MSLVYVGTAVISVIIGAVLSIQSTVAVMLPVFPTASLRSNVNNPFPVNV